MIVIVAVCALQAYLELVSQTHSSRLQHMLDATNTCLRTLAARLGLSNLLASWVGSSSGGGGSSGGVSRPPVSLAESGGVVAASDAWSALASHLVADVRQQPSMLAGGQLRDYQMHVSGRCRRQGFV